MIQRFAGDKFTGLSTDTKPLNVVDGAIFYETNTFKEYIKVDGSWAEVIGQSGYSGYSGISGADIFSSATEPVGSQDGDLWWDTDDASGAVGESGYSGVSGFSGYSGVSGADIFTSPTEPMPSTDGDLWWDTVDTNGAVGESGYSGYSGAGFSVATGTAAPSSTPTSVGQMYIDTNNAKVYVSTGTSSSSDWSLLN
jgi:hypothetical protein